MGTAFRSLDPDEDTGEWAVRKRRAEEMTAREERIADLARDLSERGGPSRRFSRLALVLAVVAGCDWIAIGVHSLLTDGDPWVAYLGTHQAAGATLAITAAILGATWCYWDGSARTVAKRDLVEELRHQVLVEEIRRVGRMVRASGDEEAASMLESTQRLINGSGGAVRQFRRS